MYADLPRSSGSGTMTRIVCVGISVFDYVFRVERLPETHVKHYARGRAEVMGGIEPP